MALNKMDSVGRKTYFFIFSVLVVFLTATTTKAGFEWVPGTAEAPAPSVTEEQPATDAAVAPEADLTEDTFTPTPELISEPLAPLPISDEKDLAMPAPAAQAAAQPVIQHVAPSEPNVLVVPEESRIKMITPNQNLPVAQTGLGAPPTASAEPSSMTPTSETLLSPVVSQAPKPLIIPPEDGLAPPPEFSQPATLMPPQPEAQPQETAVIPAPQPTRETKVIMPQDAPDSAMTMPGAEKMNIAPYPVDAAPQEITPVQQAAPQPSFTPAESFANAEGFGSDMPLVMALRQVVPPEYAFSFGNGVNPGNHVSWNGGKPWNEVVSDMAASVNLQAQIKGKVVHISRAGAPTPEKAAALQAPASPTPEAVNVESTQAPMDLTEANAAQPAPLMATTIGRNIINDPGQAAAPQPENLE